MTLSSRVGRLEASVPKKLPAWQRCTVNIGEQLSDAIARSFGGVQPERLIVREIIPSPNDPAAARGGA